MLIYQEGGINRQLYFEVDKIIFNSRKSDGTTYISSFIPETSWTENIWNHIVAIQNGLTTAIYLNGVLVDSDIHSDIYTSFTDVAYLGSAGSINYATCLIDEVRIYSRAISAEEVIALYKMKSN